MEEEPSLHAGRPVRDPVALGRAIGSARSAAGMSREELAEWVGTNATYVGRLERGEATKRLARLLQVLDTLGLELIVRRRGTR